MGATRAHRGITGKETDMVGWIILAFLIGAFVGIIIMGLCAASRAPEPHEVHIYCGKDGNMQIMTLPTEDKVIWHKPEDASGAS